MKKSRFNSNILKDPSVVSTASVVGVILLLVLIIVIAFNSINLVGSFPNMYKGQITSMEFTTPDRTYCSPMQAVSDRDSMKSHCISEGIVESDREIQGGKLKIAFNLGGTVVEQIGTQAKHYVKISAFNYKTNEYTVLVDVYGEGNNIEYQYDIGENLPRNGGVVTQPKQCTSYTYRGYTKQSCSYWDAMLNQDYVNPTTKKDFKIKLDLYAEGRYDVSSNAATVSAIYSDFVYSNCPVCSEPGQWSGCNLGETEEYRKNYKCSMDTDYKCVEYIEKRDCFKCTTDQQCAEFLKVCSATCSNGQCVETSGQNIDEKQCEKSSWVDYPVCKWNNDECKPDIMTIIITIVGVLIVLLIFILIFRKRLKRRK